MSIDAERLLKEYMGEHKGPEKISPILRLSARTLLRYTNFSDMIQPLLETTCNGTCMISKEKFISFLKKIIMNQLGIEAETTHFTALYEDLCANNPNGVYINSVLGSLMAFCKGNSESKIRSFFANVKGCNQAYITLEGLKLFLEVVFSGLINNLPKAPSREVTLDELISLTAKQCYEDLGRPRFIYISSFISWFQSKGVLLAPQRKKLGLQNRALEESLVDQEPEIKLHSPVRYNPDSYPGQPLSPLRRIRSRTQANRKVHTTLRISNKIPHSNYNSASPSKTISALPQNPIYQHTTTTADPHKICI